MQVELSALNIGVGYVQFLQVPLTKNGKLWGQGISVVFKFPIDLFKPIGLEPVGFSA